MAVLCVPWWRCCSCAPAGLPAPCRSRSRSARSNGYARPRCLPRHGRGRARPIRDCSSSSARWRWSRPSRRCGGNQAARTHFRGAADGDRASRQRNRHRSFTVHPGYHRISRLQACRHAHGRTGLAAGASHGPGLIPRRQPAAAAVDRARTAACRRSTRSRSSTSSRRSRRPWPSSSPRSTASPTTRRRRPSRTRSPRWSAPGATLDRVGDRLRRLQLDA